jgi:hypothetical protein
VYSVNSVLATGDRRGSHSHHVVSVVSPRRSPPLPFSLHLFFSSAARRDSLVVCSPPAHLPCRCSPSSVLFHQIVILTDYWEGRRGGDPAIVLVLFSRIIKHIACARPATSVYLPAISTLTILNCAVYLQYSISLQSCNPRRPLSPLSPALSAPTKPLPGIVPHLCPLLRGCPAPRTSIVTAWRRH